MKVWFLEGLYGPRKTLQRIRLSSFPFVVGRQEGLALVLDSPGISRRHAQLTGDDEGRLFVEDLGSTNGTFRNRQQIQSREEVSSGDILQFADEEFRAVREDKHSGFDLKMTQQGIRDLPDNLPGGAEQLQQLLLDGRVTALFQPIVDRENHIHAYEMLGRGTHPKLSEMPGELFRIAESLGLEVQLSELMRRVGVELAAAANPAGRFFANIHPSEMESPHRLTEEARRLHERFPDMELVLEVHEGAVADREMLEEFARSMRSFNAKVAYDDFGVGQSRLVELADVPPDYVKLDISLVQEIHTASDAKQAMVRMIVDFAKERSILTIAEGISGEAEAAFCESIGLDFMQGYYFGHPTQLEAN